MLIDYNKTISYVCPICSEITADKISIFDISGRHGKSFYCSAKACGEKCVSIRKKPSKYYISAECPVCGDSHTFVSSQDGFWSRSFNAYSCPVSDMEILCIGNREDCERFMFDNSESIDEFGNEFNGEDDLICGMLECIYALESEHKISCVCGCEDIRVAATSQGVILACPNCRRMKIIDALPENLEMLEKAHSLILKG